MIKAFNFGEPQHILSICLNLSICLIYGEGLYSGGGSECVCTACVSFPLKMFIQSRSRSSLEVISVAFSFIQIIQEGFLLLLQSYKIQFFVCNCRLVLHSKILRMPKKLLITLIVWKNLQRRDFLPWLVILCYSKFFSFQMSLY